MDNICKLVVAPAAEVRKDFIRNWRWLLGLLVLFGLYVILMAFFIHKVEHWSLLHAGYFTVINVTTVGFGDVVPISHWGKLIAGLNGIMGLLIFGFLVAVATLALQPTGWTAALTTNDATGTSEPSAQSEHQRVVTDLASVLGRLGDLIRTTEHHTGQQLNTRKIFIDVPSDVPGRAYISVRIRIDVD